MSGLLPFWSHALAAVLFATLLLWQLRSGVRAAGQGLLLAGLLLTAVWAWLTAVDPASLLASHAETARNLVWVGLLHALAITGRDEGARQHGVRLVYGAVAGVLGLQFIVDLLPLLVDDMAMLAGTAIVLRITAAAGALVLVHNLYGQAAPASRTSIRLAMVALAWTWTYDLNLYTVAYLDPSLARSLSEWRGAAVALSAPLFAMGGQGAGGWRIKLSRAATFQSLSLLAICSYFAVMAILATALRGTESNWAQGLTIAVLAAMTVAAMVLLPSARARSWTKVKLAKHLFEHRYDYRSEWLRFADTLGRSASDAPPLGERVVKAFADIVDAPAGLLIAPDESGRLDHAACWNWAERLPSLSDLDPLWGSLEADGRIVELDAHRNRWGSERDLLVPIPPSLLAEDRLWAGIPLIHNGRLAGVVLLAAPELRRALDWEDFDLLRTAGRQAASILAEAHGQQALMNAQRFEEFNRRFAFILHDVKNLVSQLSLLTRNAERHADNPEFRADMIATLKASVGKMNDLLARLAPQGTAQPFQAAAAFSLRSVLSGAIAANRRGHDVRLIGDTSAQILGDAVALEQAIGHLLQNAVEASPLTEPVVVRVVPADRQVTVEIVDKGTGMDAEFVRSRLFQPFASTKPNGFGIGAFEARSLIASMGGRLTVESRPGQGSRFTLQLPAASASSFRKSA
ncbi:XrtA/PEP-CTERM system histidine kinase PrsK [Sphingomonas sp. GCM10030256]|uniref:XrtA/PEP-CTERM system histidine kinase PrsK n=1 Tax=Sphingomonas sp. GCM10030256 TaxID=3273427 RepID=UPI0036155722